MENDRLDIEKYATKGSYHWRNYVQDLEYKDSVDHTLSLISGYEADFNTSFCDFGCGDALYTHLWAKLGYKNILGIDKNHIAISIAKVMHLVKKYKIDGLGKIKFTKGSITNIPADTDVIFLFDVFEHLPSPKDSAEKFKSKCKRIYLLNPNWESEHHTKLFKTRHFYQLFGDWKIDILDTYYNKTLYRFEKPCE